MAIKVKAGTTGCNITCSELDEALADATATYKTGVTADDKKGIFEGEQSNPDKSYDDDGNMYQTWYVQISEKNATSQPFNFTLTNQLNSKNEYITHFQLKVLDPRMNPLWYVATGDVKGTSTVDGAWQFNAPTVTGDVYNYEAASTYFAAGGKNVNYNGWRAANVPGPDGIKYHLPSRNEFCSLVPDKATSASVYSNVNILDVSEFPITPEGSTYSEISTACWGYDATTKAGMQSVTYWGTPSTSGSVTKRCAIRFIGTDYCSIWYYEVDSSSGVLMTIKSKPIDRIETSDAATLKKVLGIIENPSYNWSETNDVIVRQFYNSTQITYNGTTYRDSDNHNLAAQPGKIYIYPHGTRTSEWMCRLFRDE